MFQWEFFTMRISWLVLILIASNASCTRDITSETEELQAADLAEPIPAKYETNCLAYLTADKAFHDRWILGNNIWQETAAAIRVQDEAALRLLETREEGRWKSFIDLFKVLEAAPVSADDPSREMHDLALAARQTAFREALGRDKIVAQFVAEYIETYASSGHDIEGFDVDIVFKVAAYERQTNCPLLGMPVLLEPLEIIADFIDR